jgi:hypothetical protein
MIPKPLKECRGTDCRYWNLTEKYMHAQSV